MNVAPGRRFGVSRWLVGAVSLALVVIIGLGSRPGWTDVVVSGDLTVDTGTTTTSWTGNVDIVPGSSRQTISGTLDIGGQVPATFFALDVNAPSHWPSVAFGTLRLHDSCSGTGQHPCVAWRDTEPTDNSFDWRAFDEWMMALAAHPETRATYTFSYTPRFAADHSCLDWDIAQRNAGRSPHCVAEGSCCPPKQDGAGKMVEWQDYVSQVVTRAASRIESYELWNEPNVPDFWCADAAHGCDNPTSPQKLVKMAEVAYQTIHKIDPNAVVLTPSSVVDVSGPACGYTTDWLAAYLAAGGGQWADAISFHGYLKGCPPDVTPEHIQGGIRNIRSLLERYGLASLPIWDTESSWEGDAITDPDERAAWIARAYLIRWSEGVQRFAFYGWDFGSWGELWSNGILPAGTAFGELYTWLVGATMTSPCALSGNLWSCPLTRSNGGYKAILVWKSSMDTSTESYTPPDEYVRYQDLTGLVGNVARPTNIGRKPVLFETGPIP